MVPVLSKAISRSSLLGVRLFSRAVLPSSQIPAHHVNSQSVSTLISTIDLPVEKSSHYSPLNASSDFFLLNVFPFFMCLPSDVGTVAVAAYFQGSVTPLNSPVRQGIMGSLQNLVADFSIWLIKRTFQPSLVRKRRKHGFLRRQESVGGRKVLKRRMAKGRMRLGGS
ncbi:hypothetical protein HJC23_003824 [Cyclotella cryptica]|uniref:Large ribosomal subunit protein bL34m n=1 Tax=Cyclotella cryptica TaxID=29204 RepID=A0ABD3PYX3_9STRA|eukprot:CCRYP_009964-RA/>CCRYP_009964-RA protein AED:0.42 eAED:0.42 QI:0/-1/0/1/-1/1/1/0/166